MADESNPWTTLGTRRLYGDRWLTYDEDAVRHRSGREHTHVAIRAQVVSVAVLPVDRLGRTRLVGQWRYVHGRFTWELPRGSGPLGSDPIEAARRELAEETGLIALRWLELFRLDASAGISDERAASYVAWDCAEGEAAPEPDESLTCRALPVAEAVALALSGGITDAPSVALLLGLDARARRGDLPDDLVRLLP